jgi:apolipoprotein N-acyltransferase
VIDGDGAIRDPELFIDGESQKPTSFRDPQTGRWRRQLNAAVIQTVPLDPRSSLYVKCGDWFALTCAATSLFLALWSGWTRRSPVA